MEHTFVRQGILFRWDSEKAAANLRRHGVSFEEASEIFFDPFALFEPDKGLRAEERQVAIGLTSSWRLLFAVHVEVGESIRLISARGASPSQRRQYEDQ